MCEGVHPGVPGLPVLRYEVQAGLGAAVLEHDGEASLAGDLEVTDLEKR